MTNQWIVMTSSAKMPNSVKAPYRNVAVVQITEEYAEKGWRPAMISKRARGVLRVVHHGHYFVGKTDRCAYRMAVADAEDAARKMNCSVLASAVDHSIYQM